MAGRFNKILEFIGLVDDEPDEGVDQGRRPAGGQTYGAQQSRRAPQPAPTRPMQPEYEPRSGNRYSSARPDYDARQRSGGYPPPSGAPRYASDRSAPRGDYGNPRGDYADYGSPRADYGAPRGDYASSRSSRHESLEDEFERPRPRPVEPERERSRNSAPPVNVVKMRATAPSHHQTMIYYLRQLEECRDVIFDLIDGKTVLLNLEDMGENMIQRGIDTLSGAAFALGATMRKASDKTYLIAPNNVEVNSTNDTERRY